MNYKALSEKIGKLAEQCSSVGFMDAELLKSCSTTIMELAEITEELETEKNDTQRMSMCEDVADRWKLTAGIPIDRLREIVEADRDGRCVVIPCEAGDRVWFKDIDGRIVDEAIFKIGCFGETWSFGFGIEDIGKTVFLTREEAEQALNNKGGD